jgi:alkylation response protein AidB-like acyl-CoA dehydrogenase
MDLELTGSEAGFRDELRSWLDEHLVGDFRDVVGRGGPDDDDAWDVRRAWDRQLGAGHWIGVTWPKEYGGRGAPLSHEVILQMELAAAGAPARGGFHGETLLAPTLLTHGTEEQKQRLLPPMSRGEVVWCQGYSEPGAGSDLAGVRTRASETEGGWNLNGQKIWTTFAHHAAWMFAIVRTEAGSTRHAGLSYVLLPIDQPGVEVRPIKTLTGDSAFNEVYFHDAFVRSEDLVGAPGNGWTVAMSTLGHERATSVLGHQFSFQRELSALHDLMKRNGTIEDATLADRLAQSYIELDVMQSNNLRVLANATGRGEFGPESSIGKYLWSSWHQDFASLAMDVLANDGLLRSPEDHTSRELLGAYLRSRAETIYAGTTQVQLNVISERVLGLPREPR